MAGEPGQAGVVEFFSKGERHQQDSKTAQWEYQGLRDSKGS
jgi:hypothetical protein